MKTVDGEVTKTGNRFLNAITSVLVGLGGLLLVFSCFAFLGMLTQPHYRDPGIEALLARPSGILFVSVVAFIVGVNSPSVLACLFGVFGWARKNSYGKALVLASAIVFLVNTVYLFLPSVGKATRPSSAHGPRGVHTLPTSLNQGDRSTAATGQATSDAEELAVAISESLASISEKDVIKEFEEKLVAAPTEYTSTTDCFSVTFPRQPTITKVAAKDALTRNYQAYSADGSVSYNVFFNLFEKKILSRESQAAFLEAGLAGRLVAVNKPQVMHDDPTRYRGFAARDFAYSDTATDPAILHRGLIFFVDGDAVSLTIVHPRDVTPQYTFEEFVSSFTLLPLDPNLNDEYWEDPSTGVRLRPPTDMAFAKGRNLSTGLIATFANKAGHSLSIFRVSDTYPSYTMADVEKELGATRQDKEGWYRSQITNPSSGTAMVQVMRFFESSSGLYMIQGYAPENTFFRSEVKIKKSAQTLVLPVSFDVTHTRSVSVPKDYKGGVKRLMQAAEQGDARAQLVLGAAYARGDGVPNDYAEAAKWFTKAANQGNAKAQLLLGAAYADGRGVLEDDKEAVKWFTKAAEQGYAEAQNSLGSMYRYGEGVLQNHEEAAKWFTKAAHQGEPLAQFNLGSAYVRGEGVLEDYKEAVKWFARAAEQGNPQAQFSLGVMYGEGEGVPEDHEEAAKWLTKAAEQGYAQAQLFLGAAYSDGRGVTNDDVEAYKWAILAAMNGADRAQGFKTLLMQKMTPSQVEEAQRRAKEFVAAHQEDSSRP